jgi:predicted protein tyrosine phosphatase
MEQIDTKKIERIKKYCKDLLDNKKPELDEIFIQHLQDVIEDHDGVSLPKEEQMTKTFQFPYVGWDNIEQLEDVIGEEASIDLHFHDFDEDDTRVKYDLEITIRRTKRSDKQ